MKKRLMIVLAAVLVAGLAPVAAIAKPSSPPSLQSCDFAADRTTLAYTGSTKEGDLGYFCLWTPDPNVASWLITVEPKNVASNIALAVKYEHPGIPCVREIATGRTVWPDTVTVIADVTAGGNCGADSDNQFVLWVDSTVQKQNKVVVTVVAR